LDFFAELLSLLSRRFRRVFLDDNLPDFLFTTLLVVSVILISLCGCSDRCDLNYYLLWKLNSHITTSSSSATMARELPTSNQRPTFKDQQSIATKVLRLLPASSFASSLRTKL
jgi:hypothetical protein